MYDKQTRTSLECHSSDLINLDLQKIIPFPYTTKVNYIIQLKLLHKTKQPRELYPMPLFEMRCGVSNLDSEVFTMH